MGVVEHLERYLGRIVKGWDGGSKIRVVRFDDQPREGEITYSTLGLGLKTLRLDEVKFVRQELVVSSDGIAPEQEVVSFLLSFAEYVSESGQALRRGDVVGPSEQIIKGSRACAIYTSIPVFFEDAFQACYETSPATVFPWVMPLPREEALFVKQNGYDEFEDLLEKAQVNLFSFDRDPIV